MSEEQTSQPTSLTRPVLTEIDGIKYDLAREGQPAWPGGPPTTPPNPDWSENEKWCWERIHRGQIADLNMKSGLDKRLHPKEEELWTDEVKRQRLLSPEFLEMVLLREPWRGAVGDGGVHLFGVYFERVINMPSAVVKCNFVMGFCWLNEGLRARMSTWEGTLGFAYTRFSAELDLNGVNVRESIFMRDESQFTEVDLNGASIGGQVDMCGKAVFNGSLNMSEANVGDSLLMYNGSQFAEVNLSMTYIGGQVGIDKRSLFIGDLDAQRSTVKGDVILRRSIHEAGSRVNFAGAFIMGNFGIESSIFASDLDLRSTTIQGELSLCLFSTPVPKWGEESKLIMKRAKIGAIHDSIDAWPTGTGSIDLEGLTYDFFGGHDSGEENQLATRPGEWFVDWLAKSKPYSPQPYQQCAKVLRAAGHPSKADKVLRAGRKQARKQAWREKRYGRWFGNLVMAASIGHGVGKGYWLAAFWALIISIIGVGVAWTLPCWTDVTPTYWCAFSLDQTIPLVELVKEHSDIVNDISGWQRYWFVAQKFLGWMLALLVIAGLTGLVGRKEE